MKATKKLPAMQGPICPLPIEHRENIVLGHGSGGQLTNDLIQKGFSTLFFESRIGCWK